jgi:hypothetical protein
VVYLAKWSCLAVQAVLVAIAMVLIDNRRGDAMAEFAIGIAASVLPIAAHHRVWFAVGEEIVRARLQSGATF